uniref:Glycine rich superfamily member n=1 Tax=Rhipicephalus zambeziensis TaxID=60191 RepID=A0A224YK72_9ACAR
MPKLFSGRVLFVVIVFFVLLCAVQQLAIAGGGHSKGYQRRGEPYSPHYEHHQSRYHSPHRRRHEKRGHSRVHFQQGYQEFPGRVPRVPALQKQVPFQRPRLPGSSQDPRVRHDENALP